MARRWPSGGLELFGSAANCEVDSNCRASFRRKAISSRACLAWDLRQIPKRFLQYIQRCGSEDVIAASRLLRLREILDNTALLHWSELQARLGICYSACNFERPGCVCLPPLRRRVATLYGKATRA